jgi:hypothetical protein
MRKIPSALTRQHFILMAGLVLLCAGAGLILVTVRLVGPVQAALLTAGVIAGVILALVGIWRPSGLIWLFCSFMMISSSVFTFVMRAAAPLAGPGKIWPFYMVFAGISIAASGFTKVKRAKASFLMPSSVFVMLGLIFLPFSLRLVSMSFARFVRSVWPVLFMGAGIILIFLYVGNRIRFAKKEADEPKDGAEE